MYRIATKQNGSALIISLMILIVMTLLGLTAMGTSGLQERMAGNTRDTALAFQAAETALRDAENYYETTAVSLGSGFNGSIQGLYPQGSAPNLFASDTWANSRNYSGTIDGVAEQPRYIIELIGPITQGTEDLNISGYGESSGLGDLVAVRVSARGTGRSTDTSVVLQSYYASRN